MRVELSYGKGMLPVELPDGLEVTVIRKPIMPVLAAPAQAVASALDHPVGSRPLWEEAKGARSACILICDITRPVPNGLVLPPLIRTLLAAGMRREQIRHSVCQVSADRTGRSLCQPHRYSRSCARVSAT